MPMKSPCCETVRPPVDLRALLSWMSNLFWSPSAVYSNLWSWLASFGFDAELDIYRVSASVEFITSISKNVEFGSCKRMKRVSPTSKPLITNSKTFRNFTSTLGRMQHVSWLMSTISAANSEIGEDAHVSLIGRCRLKLCLICFFRHPNCVYSYSCRSLNQLLAVP